MPELENMGKKLLSNKVLLYGGLGVGALVIGYMYLQSQAGSSGGGGGGYASYTPVDFGSTGLPTVTGGGSSGGGGDSSGSDALAAAINSANQNAAAQNAAALEALKQSGAIAIANDQTSSFETQLATQASNYAASTNVLQTFIKQTGGQGILGLGGYVAPTSAGGASVALYADTHKDVLAWGNVLHGIANQGQPSAGSQTVTPANPITVTPPTLIPGPVEGTGGT